MAEYIDLDTPLELYVEHGSFYKKQISTLRDLLDTNRIPYTAADVRPGLRGHWITEEEAEKMGDYSLRDTCSVCGHCDWDCTESESFNFCPNCGADMRGKDNG